MKFSDHPIPRISDQRITYECISAAFAAKTQRDLLERITPPLVNVGKYEAAWFFRWDEIGAHAVGGSLRGPAGDLTDVPFAYKVAALCSLRQDPKSRRFCQVVSFEAPVLHGSEETPVAGEPASHLATCAFVPLELNGRVVLGLAVSRTGAGSISRAEVSVLAGVANYVLQRIRELDDAPSVSRKSPSPAPTQERGRYEMAEGVNVSQRPTIFPTTEQVKQLFCVTTSLPLQGAGIVGGRRSRDQTLELAQSVRCNLSAISTHFELALLGKAPGASGYGELRRMREATERAERGLQELQKLLSNLEDAQ